MARCKHKTISDHVVLDGSGEPVRDASGNKTWICSGCGLAGSWDESWGYYGNEECLRCWTAQIDVVWCSKECRKRITIREVVRREVEVTIDEVR